MPEATRARPDVRRGHGPRPFAGRDHRVIEPRLTRHHELRPHVPQPTDEPLPIAAVAQDLTEAITSHETVVLRGGTGSGKSTVGPTIFFKALQEANPQKKIKMVVAEPRQYLAKEISTRVAILNNVPLGGDLVGFYHGDDREYSKDNTQIVYTVSGSLRKRIEEDKSLEEYDAVFLDEIHLRDVDQEAILIGLKEVQKERARKGLAPLKIVIASASAKQKYADYYGNAVFKEVPGKEPQYTVEKHFAETSIDWENIPLEMGKLAAKLIKDPKNRGDVVGFLPGQREIKIAMAEFNRIMEEEGLTYKSASLMGGGGPENKATQKILGDNNPNRQPLAAFVSAVGEAGVTFAGLETVIDSGKSRVMVYDKQSGLQRLETIDHSFDDFTQRLGRVGRVRDGNFYGMYTEADLLDESKHPREALPAVLKEDLTPLFLSLKRMGIIDVYDVDYLDHPGKEKIEQAVEKLTLLGALHPDGTLTDEGREMAELPLDPHFARMLIEAKKRGCVEQVSVLVGFLNNGRSVFSFDKRIEQFEEKYAEYIHPGSDFITLLKVWNASVGTSVEEKAKWEQERGKFNESILRDARATKNDLVSEKLFEGLGLDREDKAFNLADENVLLQILRCVLAGFADRLLKRQGNTYAFQNGRKAGIEIGRASGLFGQLPELIVSANIRSPEGLGRTFAEINETMDDALVAEAPQLAFIRAQREQLAASNAAAEAAEIERQQLEAAEAAANTEAERNASQGTQENTDNNSGTTETPEPPRKLSFGERLKAAAVNIKNAIAGALQKVRQTIASIWGNIKKFFGRR